MRALRSNLLLLFSCLGIASCLSRHYDSESTGIFALQAVTMAQILLDRKNCKSDSRSFPPLPLGPHGAQRRLVTAEEEGGEVAAPGSLTDGREETLRAGLQALQHHHQSALTDGVGDHLGRFRVQRRRRRCGSCGTGRAAAGGKESLAWASQPVLTTQQGSGVRSLSSFPRRGPRC